MRLTEKQLNELKEELKIQKHHKNATKIAKEIGVSYITLVNMLSGKGSHKKTINKTQRWINAQNAKRNTDFTDVFEDKQPGRFIKKLENIIKEASTLGALVFVETVFISYLLWVLSNNL